MKTNLKTYELDKYEMLVGAYFLAANAHQGQKDKAGKDYIEHLQRVAQSFDGHIEKTVAMLHDVLEDTWVTEEMLRNLFPEEIVDAVVYLTRKEDESYGDFIKRMCVSGYSAYLARKVKIADLTDNMNIGRLEIVTYEDLERLKKYSKWRKYLTDFVYFGKYDE